MDALRAADLRAAFEFLDTAWSLAGDQAFGHETIDALADLIPCDEIGFCDLDRVARRGIAYVGSDEGDGDDDQRFWEIVDEHPLCRHQQAYGDFSATRLSDVISRRRLIESRIYRDWYQPAGIEAELEAGITQSHVRTRNFVLSRASGDFSDRDRDVLELIRPHLARIYETAELRRELKDAPDDLACLTGREREVLELVGAGLTNVDIAERLWISPGTVKKHLDNIYVKLGATNRTQAAASLRSGRELN
jgi:DNA-binding NarL/FixJ family response regulator